MICDFRRFAETILRPALSLHSGAQIEEHRRLAVLSDVQVALIGLAIHPVGSGDSVIKHHHCGNLANITTSNLVRSRVGEPTNCRLLPHTDK